MVLDLCLSMPAAARLTLIDDIGAMVYHDPVPKLPNELMLHIFSHLSPADLLTSSAVSRPWRERANDERLWHDCFFREGWSVDKHKMQDLDQLVRRKGAKVAERIMRSRRTDKPSLSRRDSRKRGREEAFSENESTVANYGGSVQESSDPEELMQGVLSTNSNSMAHDADGDRVELESGSGNYDDSDDDAATDPTELQIAPSVFSNASDPKLSWSYLYKQRRRLESNWDNGKCKVFQLPHPKHENEGHTECVYTIQHHGNTLVSGSRDKTIRIWDLDTCRLKEILTGHEASVLCLQFDPTPEPRRDVIISGGSDNLVIVWKFSTGKIMHKFRAHTESVLNLRFDDRYLITCSKDKTIKIWNRHAILPNDPIIPTHVLDQFTSTFEPDRILTPYHLLDTLKGHAAAVNAVQINGDVIVSASGDRSIKSWNLHTGKHMNSYNGHSKGIACVQFDGRRIVSGSSDNSVRIFDYASAGEVACLEGHTNLVRTVQARFGDMDIKTVQDLQEESQEADRKLLQSLDRDHQFNGVPLRRQARNAGSRRPEDMLSYGTQIPPGGGGTKWGRIVSGSYDESVIIWKQDKDGKWKPNHRLNQSAGQSTGRLHLRPQPAHAVGSANANPLIAIQQAQQVAQQTTNNLLQGNMAPGHHAATGQNLSNDAIATLTANLHGQMQTLLGMQIQQNLQNAPPAPIATQFGQLGPGNAPGPLPTAIPAAPHAHHHHVHHHHHNHAARPDTNRVFKLQFDARRIISCSQNKVVVGWDFANGDEDLEWIGDWSQETA